MIIDKIFINPFSSPQSMDDERVHTKRLYLSNHPVHLCCGKQMSYVGVETTFGDDKPDFSDDRYERRDDYWRCYECDKVKPSRKYRDWFGADDLDIEVYEYLKERRDEDGDPLSVMFSGYMACVVWQDSVIVFGYDGNEYCHTFGFELEAPKKGLLSSFNLNPPTLKVKVDEA